MDIKDRGRCDNTAETGLRAAEGQERHPVVGVRTDMNHPDKAIWKYCYVHFPVLLFVLILTLFCKISGCWISSVK